jgi:hypothetical protein
VLYTILQTLYILLVYCAVEYASSDIRRSSLRFYVNRCWLPISISKSLLSNLIYIECYDGNELSPRSFLVTIVIMASVRVFHNNVLLIKCRIDMTLSEAKYLCQ